MGEIEKKLRARVQHKHKTEAEWKKDVYHESGELREDPFVPLNGELIIFDEDEECPYKRTKIGDGSTNVMQLPFSASVNIKDRENGVALVGADGAVFNWGTVTSGNIYKGMPVKSVQFAGVFYDIDGWIKFNNGYRIEQSSWVIELLDDKDNVIIRLDYDEPEDDYPSYVFEKNTYITEYYIPEYDWLVDEADKTFLNQFYLTGLLQTSPENSLSFGKNKILEQEKVVYDKVEVGYYINRLDAGNLYDVSGTTESKVTFADDTVLNISGNFVTYLDQNGTLHEFTYYGDNEPIIFSKALQIKSISDETVEYIYRDYEVDKEITYEVPIEELVSFKISPSSGAQGEYSFTQGMGTSTTNEAEVALGKFNKSNEDTLFSVGNGTAENLSNAFRVTKEGDVYIKNDIDKLATEKYAEQKIEEAMGNLDSDFFNSLY